jgi:hypothetical protein
MARSVIYASANPADGPEEIRGAAAQVEHTLCDHDRSGLRSTPPRMDCQFVTSPSLIPNGSCMRCFMPAMSVCRVVARRRRAWGSSPVAPAEADTPWFAVPSRCQAARYGLSDCSTAHQRPLSRGFGPPGYPTKPLVSYQGLPTTPWVDPSSTGEPPLGRTE